MNRVEIMGRLTRNSKVKYTQSDNPITISRYTLAVDRRRRKGKQKRILSRSLHTAVPAISRLNTSKKGCG